MKVAWFYVFEFTPESTRKAPIGAWIWLEDGNFDYVFDSAYPDDEQVASDCCNRLIAGGFDFTREALEYWQGHLGYLRSASRVQEEAIDDHAVFIKRLEISVTP